MTLTNAANTPAQQPACDQSQDLQPATQPAPETAFHHIDPDHALFEDLSRVNNELVNLQRQLAKKNTELERLIRQKNQFLGMASHDLRNPLNAVISYSEFLLNEIGDRLDEEQLEFLSIIRSSGEFMLGLVNDLLDVAAIEAGQLRLDVRPTDVQALVKRAVKLNQILAANKEIDLQFECPAPQEIPSKLMIDAHKIEQVLNNLISNAVKFSFPDSVVTIRLEQVDDQVVVSVQDQGQGIPAHEIEGMFKPYGRTSVKSTAGEKSTGLGLMIVHRIIQGHEGKIWVDSTVGQGSTFFFALPATENVATPEIESPDTTLEPATPALRILVAEDSPINQKIVLRLLSQLGYRADVAATGVEVLESLEKQPYDVILMDTYMPELNGLEATRQIRRRWPQNCQPCIIAMTASTRTEDRDQCFAAGMDAFVGKPSPKRLDELVNVLNDCRPKTAGSVPQTSNGKDTKTTFLPPVIVEPALDPDAFAELRDIVGPDNGEELAELIDDFFDYADEALAATRTASAAGDLDRLTRTAHTLKGTAAQMGARQLSAHCADLEIISKAGQIESIPEKVAVLEAETQRVKAALEAEKQKTGLVRV